MTTYALTISTAALGLGILSNARVTVKRKRTVVSDTFPSANLSSQETVTDALGIATVLLAADDDTVFHEVRIYNSKDMVIYYKALIMPPQAVSLADLPVQDIISAAAADAAAAAAASIVLGTKKFNTYAEQMAYVGAYVDGQKADVLGYHAIGDGGFIQMYWSASSTAAHNGGTVRQPTAISGAGRWLAINTATVNVDQFGAYADGNTHSDTTYIQAAINTGANVEFSNGKTYYAQGLTMTTDRQVLFCKGLCRIIKNANGVILTASGIDQQLQNISFRGDAATPVFTGDNVNATGTGFTMLNCGSRWAYGRAVKSTKSYTRIIGTCDIYQTSDATGSGYDIELGASGQVALYCHVSGTISTQATGGILCVETGTISVDNCQIGKFTAQKGANGAGNSTPRLSNCRVNGAVSIAQSNGTFTGNQFSHNFTFELGSSLNTLDLSNVWATGSVITNSGNANNYIARNVSTGGTYDVRLGDDASIMKTVYSGSGGVWFPETITMNNAKSIVLTDSTGSTSSSSLSLSASNVLTLLSNHASGTINIYSAAGVNTYAGGTMKNQTTSVGTFRAASDNVYQLGDSGQRWSVVFAGTGTINTSDERLKQQITTDLAPELKAWAKVNFCKYKFNDAVKKKADGARWHIGVIAQQVKDAFESEGLDPFKYGILCYDEWDAEEEVLDDNGTVINNKREAGDRYGIRYEEALILECAYLRSLAKIEYNPFFPSVATQDGAVFQVLVTNEDDENVCDMEQSVTLANEYINDE